MNLRVILFILCVCAGETLRAASCIITDYGAKSDTSVISTNAIQAAIDDCYSHGGGTVIVPAGTFVTGTVFLKSNITLWIDKGATLYGSTRLQDYPVLNPDYVFFRKGVVKRALLYAEKCENIAIEGDGTIHGRGEFFLVNTNSKDDSYGVRPYLIWMICCINVRTEGVRLRNSALWMQHYLACDQVYIHHIDVYNHCNKNNDMMDIDGCHDVVIADCTGDSDDDGITFKSTSGRANENIVVTNCLVSSHCNAIKMGTESNTGFKNFTISNIVIRPSRKTDFSIEGIPSGHTGIALETVDGGIIDGICISNIRIDGTECPLFIHLGNRARAYFAGQKIDHPGKIQHVQISHIIATNVQKNGCSITGVPGYPIQDLSLANIEIRFAGGGKKETVDRTIPEKETAYPEYDMFGDLPAYGFFIRHTEGVSFHNITLSTATNDQRPALFLSGVSRGNFSGMTLSNSEPDQFAIFLENSSDLSFFTNRVEDSASGFLFLKGNQNSRIYALNNLLPKMKKLAVSDIHGSCPVKESGNVTEPIP